MHNPIPPSRLPRLLLQYAGNGVIDLNFFDRRDCEAMIQFFLRHGYLQSLLDQVAPSSATTTRITLESYRRTTKGDWLLHQLNNGVVPMSQPA
jgi:hypothetical protein